MTPEDATHRRHDNRRNHVLRRPLEKAIESSGLEDSSELVEVVLKTLDEQRVIAYSSNDTLAILTAAGRTLVVIAERPDSTLREIGAILGVGESTVAKSVSLLVRHNLIARTKIAGRNIYSLNKEELRNHPDMRRYNDAVLSVLYSETFDGGDSA
jgi:hypothetical protein